jgi:hypothetical protein
MIGGSCAVKGSLIDKYAFQKRTRWSLEHPTWDSQGDTGPGNSPQRRRRSTDRPGEEDPCSFLILEG